MSSDIITPQTSDSQTASTKANSDIVLVTGMSGAGKSTMLKTLEDMGWEIIDNFPIRLLKGLLATPSAAGRASIDGRLAIGFDTRTRGFDPASVIETIKDLSSRDNLSIQTVFLECSDLELERRYNETRRPHPLAKDRPAIDGIAEERDLLAPLRRWSDKLITTSGLSVPDLAQHIRNSFGEQHASQPIISISSFGFARGMPPVADLVFDMRFLRNPHWEESLRPLTGQDAPVGDYVSADIAFAEAFDRILSMLLFLLPRYAEQGKAYVHIAFGCTGGRHRSVFTAERIAQGLRDGGFSPSVTHRNLASRPVDAVENDQS
jgi:UPF0042 nucleotide-binding protein